MSHGSVTQIVDNNVFMRAMSNFDRWLAEFAGWIVIVMMLTISFDVAMRYVFGMPTTWSFEINRYMLVLVMFFGGGWTLPAGGHVGVDLITENLTGNKKFRLEIITSAMAVCYMIIFTWESIIYTWEAFANGVRSTEYLAWPMWPIRGFLVIGGIMLTLEFLFRIIRSFKSLADNKQ
ncbi:MAG: Tripartite ATP-independent periplasmic transporter [Smithella sp. PtaU1.Bin162]|nr:MAG: Tripartite ATP-independent periplasmic transporter [Smithella sp. PtaU1.Bin162]